MRVIRTYGSVRGALSNGRSYRDDGKPGHPDLTMLADTRPPRSRGHG